MEAVRVLLAERPVLPGVAEKSSPVRVSRHFDGSAEQLFDAWLDESNVGSWLFATPSGEMVEVALDPRVGGVLTIVERRDGEDVAHVGRYEELDRPGRLVFTLQVPRYSEDISRITVEIGEGQNGCDLVLTQEGGPPDESAAHAEGWAMILAALAERLEEMKKEDG
ncbi:SRPBCC family protein [Sphingosinicella rhizophila]|uniref:SRPBCC family protein n=1 Tax=Sphingosinicella rhizophila TaxID=3050082 RepID=A0ABU3Q8A5_9SPHN|nr:SRPBCC family protein [Sphingosinicella sp. GR2756]MDT9599329.1 SRPBCC family protein [Sphingosinicella sp. GR2756]